MFVTLRREEGEEQMSRVVDNVIEEFVVRIGTYVGESWRRGCPIAESDRAA